MSKSRRVRRTDDDYRKAPRGMHVAVQ